MLPKKKMKGRVIVLLTKGDEKLFVGNSAAAIARDMGKHKLTLTRAARLAEKSGKGKYENSHYTVWVTDKFIKGAKRNGNFTY